MFKILVTYRMSMQKIWQMVICFLVPVSDTPCGIGKPGEKYKGFYSMAQSYS